MEHEITFTRTMTITTEDLVQLFSCEGGGFDYWATITYDKATYAKTRERMASERPSSETICYEDVLAEMIESGEVITVRDFEEETDYSLDIDTLLKGFILNAEQHPNDADICDGDADTADRILQYAIFDDIIYG